jgi:subtilisin-like proprotein convertase family protein/V8-like Glu-specific endopeptidase
MKFMKIFFTIALVTFVSVSCRNEMINKSIVIYGDNDLRDVNVFSSPKWEKEFESVGLITEKSRLSRSGNVLKFDSKKDYLGKICQGEILANAENLGHCTGFLVRPDLLATARHCVEVVAGGCRDLAIVFDVKSKISNEAPKSVSVNNVYHCSQVFYPLDESEDQVLIKLDRKRSNSNLDLKSEMNWDTVGELTALGHPLGGVQKVSEGGIFRKIEDEVIFTELDVFEGNSGSPVLSGEGKVLGMLFSGEADFERDGNSCLRVKRCQTGSCSGERLLPANAVNELIKRVDLLEKLEKIPSKLLFEETFWENTPIPDYVDGQPVKPLESTFNIDDPSRVTQVLMELSIEHENFTDLEFQIIAPDGTEYKILSQDVGDFTQSRKYIFDTKNNKKLMSLLGKDANGDWRLVIKDQAMTQEGSIKFLKIRVSGTSN